MKTINRFFFILIILSSQVLATEKILEAIYQERVSFHKMLDKRYDKELNNPKYAAYKKHTLWVKETNEKKLKALQDDYKNNRAEAYKRLYKMKVDSLNHSIKSVKSYPKERFDRNKSYYTNFLQKNETMLKGLLAEYKNYTNPPKLKDKIKEASLTTNSASQVKLKSSNLKTNVQTKNINVSGKSSIGAVSIGKKKD